MAFGTLHEALRGFYTVKGSKLAIATQERDWGDSILETERAQQQLERANSELEDEHSSRAESVVEGREAATIPPIPTSPIAIPCYWGCPGFGLFAVGR